MKAFFLVSILLIPLTDRPATEKFQAAEQILINTVVDHDLYLAGSKVTLSAPVQGDVMAAGSSIMIRDSIAGDLVLAGGDLVIDGVVSEDLLVMGGTVRVMQPVQGDLIVMGGDVTIDPKASIGQDLVVMAGEVNMEGLVGGNVLARGGKLFLAGICRGNLDVKGGELEINGTVDGTSTLAAERIQLGSDAKLYGNVRYWLEDQAAVSFSPALMNNAQAQYDESLELEETSFWTDQPWSWIPLVLAYLLSALLLIVLINILLPKVMERSGRILNRETVKSFGYGVLYYVGAPLAIGLLFMTIIGIPLGLFLLSFYIFSVLFALSFSAVTLTYQLHDRYDYHWSRGKLISVSFGIFIMLRLLSFVPFLGFALVGIVIGACIGAFIYSFFYKEKIMLAQTA